jgi:hyperpolarization activated cyclic nucleotide-gated potassium channel 1
MAQYTASIYWAFTSLTTTGYGDISPYTVPEQVFSIMWMLFGLFFMSFTVSNTSSILGSVESKGQVLTNKMLVIDQFAKDVEISSLLKRRLKRALSYSIETAGSSIADKHELFEELPKNLRYEIVLLLHNKAAARMQLFKNRDSMFVIAIVPFLTPLFVDAGEFVFRVGDHAGELYLVNTGKVEYILEKHVYKTVGPGIHFGEIDLINQSPRHHNVRASVPTNLLFIIKDVFFTIRENFPTVFKELNQTAR